MSISVNGQSQVPPGFRFHPTEEELLLYYLKKKVGLEKIDLDVIQDVDLNKLEPWDIQEKCRIGTTPQNDWYFFSHKDKKYPTGTRTNRATCSGFWKATGRDKVIYGNSRRIGMRKTLVFYKGRAPHGQKSDWIMHEYRLDDNTNTNTNTNSTSVTVCNGNGNGNGNGEGGQEEGWVVCRVFKKKYLGLAGHKVPDIPTWSPSSTINSSSCNEGSLEEMLQSMATPSRRDHDLLQTPDNNMTSRRFLKLPGLNSSSSCRTNCYQPLPFQMFAGEDTPDFPPFISPPPDIQDWAALDRLVASHLNGPSDGGAKQHLSSDNNIDPRMSFIVDDNHDHHQMLNSQQQQRSSSSRRYGVGGAQDYQNEGDIWGFAPTSNDQICDVSSVHPI